MGGILERGRKDSVILEASGGGSSGRVVKEDESGMGDQDGGVGCGGV